MKPLHIVCITLLTTISVAAAEDRYLRIAVSSLSDPATQPANVSAQGWLRRAAVRPYVSINPPVEAYLTPTDPWADAGAGNLFIRAPHDKPEVGGTLFLPNADFSGMNRIEFSITDQAVEIDAAEFNRAKAAHYQSLRQSGVAGAAWFRHQQQLASETGGGGDGAAPPELDFQPGPARADELSDTYALFSGGRAVSENLQLDRALPPVAQSPVADVDVASIEGITVQEMDFKALIEGKNPGLDPLARLIPADQHALFFPSFSAAMSMLDEAEKRGSLLLIAAEQGSEDAGTRRRYEKQLCLPLGQLARLVGPSLIKSIAVTGSDPYLRLGSDVAVIFETPAADALLKMLPQQIDGAEKIAGEIDGVKYTGLVSSQREISCYRAALDGVLIVTNSKAQLERIIQVHKDASQSLAVSPEYLFFRDRYARGEADETALLVLTDAAIRRWCGPRWRIADSRRTRAMAILSQLQARHAGAILDSRTLDALEPEYGVPELGLIELAVGGASSSTYGSLDFLTPIAELPLEKVTQAEADAYARWRDTYQQNWRRFFDPIAARLTVADQRLAADVTVMPLIFGTDYRELVALSRGAKLLASSGDPHDGAIAHLTIAINPESPTIQQFGQMMQGSVNLRVDPLAWLGNSVALYADEDPFWEEMAQSRRLDPDWNDWLFDHLGRLPVALHADAKDAMRLAAFLTAVHAMAEQSAPELLRWEKLMHGERSYVKVSPTEQAGLDGEMANLAVYYAATPKALMVTLSETMLKRYLDRQPAKSAAIASAPATQPAATQPIAPWPGENVGLRLEREFMALLGQLAERDALAAAQVSAWSNIAILNEWKRLYPDQDPQNVHERLWKVRLLDPAGGSYTWNEQWQTMQSQHYGHPGEQKEGPAPTDQLKDISAEFGLTFENEGVRARGEVRLK